MAIKYMATIEGFVAKYGLPGVTNEAPAGEDNEAVWQS
jgi:hypothetical protein